MAEPWEYVDPGTESSFVGGTEFTPSGKMSTLIGEVTPIPVHEPYCVQDTKTLVPSCMIAGLSWNCASEFAAIW